MFLREKKGKTAILYLMSENSDITLSSPCCLHLSCDAFCSKICFEKKLWRVFSSFTVCLKPKSKPGYHFVWSTWSLASSIPAQDRGIWCPPGTSAGPWGLDMPCACHQPHPQQSHTALRCLRPGQSAVAHIPYTTSGSCSPRTGHMESIRMGKENVELWAVMPPKIHCLFRAVAEFC